MTLKRDPIDCWKHAISGRHGLTMMLYGLADLDGRAVLYLSRALRTGETDWRHFGALEGRWATKNTIQARKEGDEGPKPARPAASRDVLYIQSTTTVLISAAGQEDKKLKNLLLAREPRSLYSTRPIQAVFSPHPPQASDSLRRAIKLPTVDRT